MQPQALSRSRVLLALALVAGLAGLPACGGSGGGGGNVDASRRDPYVQTETPTSVVLRWRTPTATDARVEFGAAPGALDQVAVSAAVLRDHAVTVTGLNPDQRYYYAVGDADARVAGGDEAHFFTTAPAPLTDRLTRVWVVGDVGTAEPTELLVRDGAATFEAGHAPDLWLALGDNAYENGTDADYQRAVFNVFPALLATTPLWPTFGNHDDIASDAATERGPYFDLFTLPTAAEAGGVPSGTEAYYAFDYGDAHFVSLDSTNRNLAPRGPMLTWLAQDVAATQARWIVAFWH
ncbi:MAG: metallophosphoesterase family protein, partial [Myxococcales bacterium]|nr:metallophosphoesterase family protein [Myxococcales bacterium]